MFNEILKELRTDAELTQEELGEKLNISRTAISKYETGEHEPNLSFLIKLSDYFSVSIDYLLGKTKIRTPGSLLHDFNSYPPNTIKQLSEILICFKNNKNYIKFVHAMLNEIQKLK